MQNKPDVHKTTPGFVQEIAVFFIVIATVSMLAAFGLFVIINEVIQ